MALTAATVSCLLALVVGIVWVGIAWVRQRPSRAGGVPSLAPALALTGAAAGLVALDLGPRQHVDRQIDVCGLEGLDVRLASTPVMWQLVTGGLRGEVRVPSDAVVQVVVEQMTEGPFMSPHVTLTYDAMRVDAVVTAPTGRVPVELYVDLFVDHGELVLAPGEVRVAGRVVPDGMLDSRPIDGALRRSDVRRMCADEQRGARHPLTGVDVDPDGLVLSVTV